MENNIVDIEEYKRIMELYRKFDNHEISEEDLSEEDIDKLIAIYKKRINNVNKEIDEIVHKR